MSKFNQKGKWYPARVTLLTKMAESMTIAELADWFKESESSIRQAIKYYGIDYKNGYRCRGEKKITRPKQMNAQESIALFKKQYKNDDINQLLTSKWSQHEQIRTH